MDDIQAGHISRAEGSSFGITGKGTQQKINLLSPKATVKKIGHDAGHRKYANAVSNKVGCVFATNHAFTQRFFTEAGHKIRYFGGSIFRGNHLQQLHITRRVKEVRSQKMAAKLIQAFFADLTNGQSR